MYGYLKRYEFSFSNVINPRISNVSLDFPFILLACESEKPFKRTIKSEATITSHSDGALLPTGTEIVFAAGFDANHGAEELMVLWKSDARTLCEEETVDPSGEVLCTVVLEEEILRLLCK